MLVQIAPRGTQPRDKLTLEINPDGQVTAWHAVLFSLGLSPCLMPKHRCSDCPASAYVSVQTEFRDAECLVGALREMGYTVEHHEEAVALRGYQGDTRSQRANVVIRRQHVGHSANDVGWERTADGTYKAHISEYDHGNTFQTAKQKELAQRYAVAKVKKQAKAKGYAVTEQKSDSGQIKLKLRRW